MITQRLDVGRSLYCYVGPFFLVGEASHYEDDAFGTVLRSWDISRVESRESGGFGNGCPDYSRPYRARSRVSMMRLGYVLVPSQ